MNDIRNLMQTLHGEVEYREFPAAEPAPVAGSWALLARLERGARPPASVSEGQSPAPGTFVEAVLAAQQDVGGAAAAQMHAAAVARGARGFGQLRLGKYAAPADAAAGRRLPLTEVFARLAAGAPSGARGQLTCTVDRRR